MTSPKTSRPALTISLGALAFGAATLATGGGAQAGGCGGAPAARPVRAVLVAQVQTVPASAPTCSEVRERVYHPSLGAIVRTVRVCR